MDEHEYYKYLLEIVEEIEKDEEFDEMVKEFEEFVKSLEPKPFTMEEWLWRNTPLI